MLFIKRRNVFATGALGSHMAHHRNQHRRRQTEYTLYPLNAYIQFADALQVLQEDLTNTIP